MPATKKFEVLDPIEHDGKRYEVGSSIELSDHQAEPLLALRAVSAPPTKAKADAEAKAKADADGKAAG